MDILNRSITRYSSWGGGVNKSAAVYSGQGGCTDFPFDVAPLKSSNTPITFPKLHVVLATHLLGSTSRRLLVNAVKLCCADHLPAASITNTLYRMMAVPSKSGTVMLIECPKAAPN